MTISNAGVNCKSHDIPWSQGKSDETAAKRKKYTGDYTGR